MGNFFDFLGGIGLFLIIIAIFLIIIIIRLICAIFEMNDNIKDIRKILTKDYNEKHPDNKFKEEKPYNEENYNTTLH